MSTPTHIPRYRVWDGHRMHAVTRLHWSICGLHWESETGRGWVSLDMAYWMHNERGRPRGRPKVDVLMAATGVQDSKGSEVWEGDIVHVNGRHSVIERRPGHWGRSWSDYHLGCCDFVGGGPVVVGNRHEHPDLLVKALSPHRT